MNIKIGAKIKALRKRDDITQEQLAEILGVSNQAISRWESESGYPDIEYITPLANFFNVTIDYLFDHDTEGKRRKIDEYCEQYEAHKRDWKPPQDRLDMMRQALAEFPADEKLLIRLASALYDKWCDYGWQGNWVDGYYIYDVEKYKSFDSWDEAVKIMEELLTVSTNDNIRRKCRQLLAYIYGKIGEKDKLLAIAEQCDDIPCSKQTILSGIVDGQEGIMYAQEELLTLLRCFMHPFGRIARSYIRDPNVIIKAYAIILDLYKFIFNDGNYGFYNYDLYDLYLTYAYESLKQDKLDETFKALENSYSHAKMFDIFINKIRNNNENHVYTAPYVNLLKTNSTHIYAKEVLPGWLRGLKDENGFFKKLHGNERFTKLINKIEAEIALI